MPSRHARIEVLLAAFVSFAIVSLALYARWHSLRGVLAAIDRCELIFCDFHRHFHPMGRAVLAGSDPVRGFYYPPFAALCFAAFGALPLATATWCWGAIQLASLVVLVTVPQRWITDRASRRWFYAALVATSFPIVHDLKWGQVSLPLAALVVGAVALRESGRVVVAAAVIAFAASIKGYPALVLLPFVLRRDTRFVTWSLAFGVVFTAGIPALVMGPSHAWHFARAVSASAATAMNAWIVRDANSQYFAHVVSRVCDEPRLATSTSLRALGFILAAANLPLVGVLARTRRTAEALDPLAWLVTFACIPFVLRTSWPHYFTLLPLTHLLLAERVATLAEPRVRTATATLLAVSIACSSVLPLFAFGYGRDAGYMGCVFTANAIVLVCAWVVAVRPHRSASVPPAPRARMRPPPG